jgi:hypothetical protein
MMHWVEQQIEGKKTRNRSNHKFLFIFDVLGVIFFSNDKKINEKKLTQILAHPKT